MVAASARTFSEEQLRDAEFMLSPFSSPREKNVESSNTAEGLTDSQEAELLSDNHEEEQQAKPRKPKALGGN
jgi:hypothetical protein